MVGVVETVTTGIFFGIATGQNVQARESTDQYRSMRKRRYPTDNRLDIHFSADCVSNTLLPKHAAVTDTPELVI